MTAPAAFSARLLRVRMSQQVNYHVNGAIVSITPEQALHLPLPDLYRIVAALDGAKASRATLCATATASIRPETPLWSLWLALS